MNKINISNITNQMTDAYSSIGDYLIEIGVVSDNSHRKTTVSIGLTNAELMFIHENGSPLRNIPARPVLKMSIDESLKKLIPETLKQIEDGCFNHNWTKDNVKIELEKLCQRIQNYARWIIYQSDLLEPNKPSTIVGKGSDRPLLNTGQLARSITCRLVKNK